jgi:hypothetical protein
MKQTAIRYYILWLIFLIAGMSAAAQGVEAAQSSPLQIDESQLLQVLDLPSLRISQLERVFLLPPRSLSSESRNARQRDLAVLLISRDPRLIQSLSFRLTRGSGAAFRDLQYLELFPDEVRANAPLSGSDLVAVLAKYEGSRSADASAAAGGSR